MGSWTKRLVLLLALGALGLGGVNAWRSESTAPALVAGVVLLAMFLFGDSWERISLDIGGNKAEVSRRQVAELSSNLAEAEAAVAENRPTEAKAALEAAKQLVNTLGAVSEPSTIYIKRFALYGPTASPTVEFFIEIDDYPRQVVSLVLVRPDGSHETLSHGGDIRALLNESRRVLVNGPYPPGVYALMAYPESGAMTQGHLRTYEYMPEN